jgi:hypothetical protein
LGWSYAGTVGHSSFSGIRENDTAVWSHPPRDGEYAILEINPFPYIRFPLKPGAEWDWNLEVGDKWSNKNWVTWEGGVLIKSHYRDLGPSTVNTPLGQLVCERVQA